MRVIFKEQLLSLLQFINVEAIKDIENIELNQNCEYIFIYDNIKSLHGDNYDMDEIIIEYQINDMQIVINAIFIDGIDFNHSWFNDEIRNILTLIWNKRINK
jgi:hypothetical protein